MPKETVLIACRLPNGIILHHPKNKKVTVTLAGASSCKIIGSRFGVTEVDAEFWTAWKAVGAKSAIFSSNAVFEARNEAEAASRAKELQKERTGFEAMPQSAMGVERATV